MLMATIDLYQKVLDTLLAAAHKQLGSPTILPEGVNEASLKRTVTKAQIDRVKLPSDDDGSVEYDQNCNQIRCKIRTLIDSGEVKVTHWLQDNGINSNSYGCSMKLSGPWSGVDNHTFHAAYIYFKKGEATKIPPPSKKRKTAYGKAALSKADVPDVSGVTLPGEDEDDVEVYDNCDEIRRKISAHLRREGVTAASFLR